MKKQNAFLMFFCILIILVSGQIKAQENDYIITNSGEKVYGEIPRNFDFNNSESIKFNRGNNQESAYTPEEIMGFGLDNGRLFLSIALPELERKVFAQIVFSGKLSLISYKTKYFLDDGNRKVELKSSFKTIDESGRQVKNTNRKPYLGVLNSVMAGECGSQLQTSIFSTGFNEQDLISIFQKYHLCENLPYQIHVEKIPFLKFSTVASLGFNLSNKTNSFSSIGRYDVFEKNLFPMIQAGIKLYEFRKAPRFSFDTSIGFTTQNNTLKTEYINSNIDVTGTETFKLTSIFVPIFLNYSLLKIGNSETYMGVGGTLRANRFVSEFAMIDDHYQNGSVTFIYERPIMSKSEQVVSPAVKIGTHFNSKSRIGIVSELQVDYLRNSFSANVLNSVATYNHIMFSFLIGVRF